jgi:hypothetical protein
MDWEARMRATHITWHTCTRQHQVLQRPALAGARRDRALQLRPQPAGADGRERGGGDVALLQVAIITDQALCRCKKPGGSRQECINGGEIWVRIGGSGSPVPGSWLVNQGTGDEEEQVVRCFCVMAMNLLDRHGGGGGGWTWRGVGGEEIERTVM